MTKVFWKILKESQIPLTLATVVGVLSGALLEMRLETLVSLPILLAIVPPLNDMAGDLGTIIVARLTTAFYLGSIEPKLRKNKGLRTNLFSLMLVSAIIIIYISFVISPIYSVTLDAGSMMFTVLVIVVLAGMMGVFFTLLSGIILSILSFKKGYNPDIVVMPMITLIGDFLSIASIIFVARMFGLV
ncbi:MAG: magnesium transporter [Nitrososphaerota archaeon]|nr:magnesium transporter [Aigarchaeota archaeon]MDW8076682.1 magnesium transporter [Nitrososphaerota archaeon]